MSERVDLSPQAICEAATALLIDRTDANVTLAARTLQALAVERCGFASKLQAAPAGDAVEAIKAALKRTDDRISESVRRVGGIPAYVTLQQALDLMPVEATAEADRRLPKNVFGHCFLPAVIAQLHGVDKGTHDFAQALCDAGWRVVAAREAEASQEVGQ